MKSPFLSLMSSVQHVLYETICSKPRCCYTGLHNSGFRSCHVGVHALSKLEEAQTVPCNSLCFKGLGTILKACPSPVSAVTSFACHWNTQCVGEVTTVEGESTHNVNILSPCIDIRREPNKWPCKEGNLLSTWCVC